MKIKHFGIMILASAIMWGCGNNSDEDKANNDEASSQQEVQTQEQTQQNPGMMAQQPQQSQPPAQGNQQMQQQMPGQMQQQPADIEVSDAEMKKFVQAAQQVQMIGMQAQQQMAAAVQKKGMNVQRYQQIMQQQQNPNQQSDATEEEMNTINELNKEFGAIQKKAEQQMIQKIKDAGMTESRFQEISTALRNSTELQQQLQEQMPKPQAQQQMPPQTTK